MKRKICCWALVLAVLLGSTLAWADDFYVIAGGAVGTPITSVPKIISQPGFYYLKGNLKTANTTDTAITINASGVTLDLMGFDISPPAASSGDGIRIGAAMNVEVRNGSVSNFTRGVFSDWTIGGLNHRLANLRVSFCGIGIYGSADGIIVSGCQALGCGDGFYNGGGWGSIYEKNTAMYNANSGFTFSAQGNLINNASTGNSTGFALPAFAATFVDRNSAYSNTANYTGLAGCTVGINTP